MHEEDRELLKELKDQAETLRSYLVSSIGGAAIFLVFFGGVAINALGPTLSTIAGAVFCFVIMIIASAFLLKHGAINQLTREIANSRRHRIEEGEERYEIDGEGELIALPHKKKR